MDEKKLTLPGELVKKNNEFIRSKLDIETVQGSKIFASLVACINKEDTEFKNVYRISVKDILSELGGENYRRIKNICIELRKAGVDIEFKDASGEPVFITFSIFSRVKYSKGIIEAKFNTADPLIADCLLNLREKFTVYSLSEYLKLPSIYSQRLFEILKSWSAMPEVVINTGKLHHMLNTPPSFRADFRKFRVRVLEKAYEDIHENTSLRYEWEPIKVGRSVEEIRFLFTPKRKALVNREKEEKEKLKQQKQSRINNSRFIRAMNCWQSKNKECREQTEKPIVCKICHQTGIFYGK